ncbi:MAG: stress protein [Opitutae bacterium]|nr:stress protein [Opitutae bacterium]|tara:strand:+ start:2908 stop:3291 length:384 start_codon:yes stop_codon:yes gene_type:complete
MRFVPFFLLLLCSGCISIEIGKPPKGKVIHHVVLCWLKEPGNAEHRQQIVEATESFRKIPGVLAARAGQVIPSERAIVDDSFDVGILILVPDDKRLTEYLEHPIHQKAKEKILLPLVEKIVVYDFQE